jgi:hypothetical protein
VSVRALRGTRRTSGAMAIRAVLDMTVRALF